MSRRDPGIWGRWAAVAILVVVAGMFSFLNAGERVAVNVGYTVIYRISLVGLVFGAFLLGMVAMFLFGLRHDRRIREALREQDYREQAEAVDLYTRSTEPPS